MNVTSVENFSCFIAVPRAICNRVLAALAALVTFVTKPFFILVDICRKPSYAVRSMAVISLLDFYRGGRNDRGATLEEIWKWDDATLEAKHDFIQWLFPIKTRGMNPTAPPTDKVTIAAFQKDKVLRDKMVKSLNVMLRFYGFERNFLGTIQMSSNFQKQAKNWLTPGNHNYLRISRILQSLKLHGLQGEAQNFFHALDAVYQAHSDKIGTGTFSHWKS